MCTGVFGCCYGLVCVRMDVFMRPGAVVEGRLLGCRGDGRRGGGRAPDSGACIRAALGGTLTISNSIVFDCQVVQSDPPFRKGGGAIFVETGVSAIITASVLRDNRCFNCVSLLDGKKN